MNAEREKVNSQKIRTAVRVIMVLTGREGVSWNSAEDSK